MKLIKTKKYYVKIKTPCLEMGQTTESFFDLSELYPQLYTPLYKFERTNKLIILGDKIWRVNPKPYTSEPKQMTFAEAHINCDFEVFPDKETCEQYIAEKELKTEKKYKQSSIYQALETIVLFSNIVDFDNISLSEIKRRLSTINQQATIAFKELKNNE